jgi:hypothetical protein
MVGFDGIPMYTRFYTNWRNTKLQDHPKPGTMENGMVAFSFF